MKAHQLHDSTSIVQKFKFSLPVDADDVYYWDIIGNISTRYVFFFPLCKS